jgi:hypothetical protein
LRKPNLNMKKLRKLKLILRKNCFHSTFEVNPV